MPIVFLLFVAGWFAVLKWFLNDRTFNRLFVFLMNECADLSQL